MCAIVLEDLDKKTLIDALRKAPTLSEFNAVCLALRQHSRRNERALELLDNINANLDHEDAMALVSEAKAILEG